MMVGASKILTVSYGTFSCTLEGFDEPFSTMKSIAEYFRDLAADDRYFGAEPPTPDAEMLHRIAEREVQRRVEARVQSDGIVLRQMQDETQEATAAAAPVAATLADLAELSQPPAEQAPAETPEAAFEAEPDAETKPEVEPEVAAEEMVAEPGVVEVVAEIEVAEIEVAEPEIAELTEKAEEEIAEPEEELAEPLFGTEEAHADEIAEAPAVEEPAEEAPVLLQEPMFEDESSVAAKLSRIRAVVGGAGSTTDAEIDDDFEQPVAPAANFDVSLSSAFEEDTAEAEQDEFATDEEFLQPEAELSDAVDADWAEEEETPVDEVAAEPKPVEAAAEPFEAEDEVDANPAAAFIQYPDEGEVEEEQPAETAPEAVAIEHAEEEGEEFEEETPPGLAQSSLSDEDEAELLAMLKTVEATTADGQSAGEDHEEYEEIEEPAAEVAADPVHASVDAPTNGDSAVERILEETNTKMDETEGSRRRSAIAHLKAAVAATKADRLLQRVRKNDDLDAEEQSQYRDDLAKVVRPRRPVDSGEHPSERPAPLGEAPAPLVLVSEQRVPEARDHVAEERPAAPSSVLPRRVSRSDAEMPAETGDQAPSYGGAVDQGFAEFAEEMGASELPDLLEAAAAYSAFVEGNKHFSRPQLMRKVASFDHEQEISREAGLRSFGQLLRQGKIQKLRRGQFTIREDTRFNPEARLAGE